MSFQNFKGLSKRTIPSQRHSMDFRENHERPFAQPLLGNHHSQGNSHSDKVVIPHSVSLFSPRNEQIDQELVSFVKNLHVDIKTKDGFEVAIPRLDHSFSESHSQPVGLDGPRSRPGRGYIGITPVPGSKEFFRPVDKQSKSGIDHTFSLIQRIEKANEEEDAKEIQPSASPPPNLDMTDRQVLLQLIEDLRTGTVAEQRRAVAEIRMMTKSGDESREMIADAGAIPPLFRLLRSSDTDTVEQAVTALLNLSIFNPNKSLMVSLGVVDPLVDAMKSSIPYVRENAAATIFSLSVVDDNKVVIGSSGAIPCLVELLKNGSEQGQRDACKALFNLSILSTNKWRIVGAGAVGRLVEILQGNNESMVEKSVAVLANLATTPEGRKAIGEHEDAISELVDTLDTGTPRARENSAATLLQLARHDPSHKQAIMQEVILPPLIALCQKGTPRARDKAETLLKVLREFKK